MGKYDKEIARAQKIGEDWKETSKGYEARLLSIKKDSLALEKKALTDLQNGIDKGQHNHSREAHAEFEDQLSVIKERLEMYMKEGQRLFDEHEKWALGDPRSNMGFIGKQLKLGDARSEPYMEVATGIKRLLTEVASAISSTQKAWKEDLRPAIEIQLSRVTALEKILSGEKSKASAFLDQIKDEAKAFVESCQRAWINLKVDADAVNLPLAQQGKLDKTATTKNAQMYQLYEKKLKIIPEAMAQIEKNHGRVLKSVPRQFIDGFMASSQKKEMEEAKNAVLLKLKQANTLYTKLVEAYQKGGYV
jgi:hypothetical protein